MTVMDQLASSLGRRDEVPDQELPRRLADSADQRELPKLPTTCGTRIAPSKRTVSKSFTRSAT